jgi:hypothetical protein
MSTVEQLDLNAFRTGPENRIFSGRDRGEEVRARAGLDKTEERADTVQVLIPSDTFTLNLSFFLGLFTASVKKHGAAWFNAHYQFTGPEIQVKKIPTYVDEAVKESIPLPGR